LNRQNVASLLGILRINRIERNISIKNN